MRELLTKWTRPESNLRRIEIPIILTICVVQFGIALSIIDATVWRVATVIPFTSAAVAFDRTLGGLCDFLEVEAPSTDDAEALCAGRQQDELGEVPIEHRQLGELLGVESRRNVGAIDLQQRHPDIVAIVPGQRPEAAVRVAVLWADTRVHHKRAAAGD